jgi:hypothetical protein
MIFLGPEWWTIFSSAVTHIWEISMMLVDIISFILLLITLILTVFIRIAMWIPGPQPEDFLIKVRDYLTKFIASISPLSRKKM